MRPFVLIFLALVLSAGELCADPLLRVRSIRVEGNVRIPAETVLHYVGTRQNSRLDPLELGEDIRRLHETGAFRRLSVLTEEAGDGLADVVYRVEEHPPVASFTVEGVGDALSERLLAMLRQEKLALLPADPFRPVAANRAALRVQRYLRERKYSNARVRWVEAATAGGVRVRLEIQPGIRIGIGGVEFTGNQSFADRELRGAMEHTRTGKGPWSQTGSYVPELLAEDLSRIRTFYRSRGFASVRVGEPVVRVRRLDNEGWMVWVPFTGAEEQVVVTVPVTEGGRYEVVEVRSVGDAKAASARVDEILNSIRPPWTYDDSRLRSARDRIQRALGEHGYARARVDLEQKLDDAHKTVEAVFTVDPGDPVLVGAIRFEGNERLPDRFLRRELSVLEGEIFDASKLDQSLKKLNRSGMIAEIDRSDTELRWIESENSVDIVFRVKEKSRQGLFATGGSGDVAGGHLGLLYSLFNLFGLGETLTLELDGGAAQSNVLLNIAARRLLGSPVLLAFSAFHRYADLNVASLVPGAEDVVSLFRRTSVGAGLTGAYEVTDTLRAGAGIQLVRESVAPASGVPEPGGKGSLRAEQSHFIAFDTATGSGSGLRGNRWSFGHALTGDLRTGSVETERAVLRFDRAVGDSWTGGRNSFVLGAQAGWVRSLGAGPVPVEEKFFPGSDLARGFRRGSLAPWRVTSPHGVPEPAGADALAGASAEYRIPFKGRVSASAFADVAWTGASGVNPGVIDETNGRMRASLGGELRVRLPLVRQPARLILSWNPLRMESVMERAGSAPLSLADPRGTVRFALGGLFY